jgi:tetratricopeptide (TPR) repeat protein
LLSLSTEFYFIITVNRLFLIAFIFFYTASLLSAQKSKVIGVFQLIEQEKFEEAKGIIEDASKRRSTKKWPRTWYARGLLCQSAFKKGMKKKDDNLLNLYTNPLYVAYGSFEMTRHLDKHGRFDKLLVPRYVLLVNDLTNLGKKDFNEENFKEAFRAFETALQISRSNILSVELDTNLLYNTALSAYKNRDWKAASKYLKELDMYHYSANIPHLIFSAYMMQSDTVSAKKALLDGINNYEDNEQLVLLLVDFLFKKNEPVKAVKVLDGAFKKDTSNYKYPYTKGLLYQKIEEYEKAINAYTRALTIPSDTVKIYTSIGTCYFNMGAEMEKRGRRISDNSEYRRIKEKSTAVFESALVWFEKAYEMDNDNQEIISKLNQLYIALDKKEKIINPEP